MTHDPVNNPDHYKSATPEAIDVIEGHNLNFNRGNIVKYALRAGKKGDTLQAILDMEKVAWYARREADRMRKGFNASKAEPKIDPIRTAWGSVSVIDAEAS
jgi:hypothetical protein